MKDIESGAIKTKEQLYNSATPAVAFEKAVLATSGESIEPTSIEELLDIIALFVTGMLRAELGVEGFESPLCSHTSFDSSSTPTESKIHQHDILETIVFSLLLFSFLCLTMGGGQAR